MGMRQRLGVAACLLGDPELLILDEPMNGLDPAGMHEMRTMITSLADEGRTVVLSSHLLDEVERTCDAVAIVDRGRVIRQGPIDELTRGAGAVVVQVDCAVPDRAARLIDQGRNRGGHRSAPIPDWPSPCPPERRTTSSPTSTGGWSWLISTSTASGRSRRRLRTGSCP